MCEPAAFFFTAGSGLVTHSQGDCVQRESEEMQEMPGRT